ncbi:unnamed protein product [Notodromas monacha]|uniref:Uncharacterized protein n=1 Tax=Notodromas monacha TaxID=399045 RepID=A0A7R9BTD9_9CRUS|nr:unnamed protein product [Notodromas monacha]CAG0921398.1 unnamed protein product [Notodromas monacha]
MSASVRQEGKKKEEEQPQCWVGLHQNTDWMNDLDTLARKKATKKNSSSSSASVMTIKNKMMPRHE